MNKLNNEYSLLNKLSLESNSIAFVINNFEPASTTFVSDSITLLTGFSKDEVINFPENHYSLINEEDFSTIKNSIIEFESNPDKNYQELTYRITTKDGRTVWIKDLISVERSGEKIINRKNILINISGTKESEINLQTQKDNLAELNSQKDKFISIISHDLKSPFTTLLGFSEILLNEEDLGNDERNEYIRYIYESSRSQLDFINCLLDWSRLQTGRVKIEHVRLNLKQITATAIAPLIGNAIRKNIDMKVDIPADIAINADERLITQAIVHLTNNAIKFTPEGKDVHISAGRFKEGFVEIIVRDEGMGIAEENQSKLFRIDQKFALQGTGGEKGSGLGLTLVKEIVDKHNGQVWFYSQIGEGSEFHFTVPEAKNTILIIEDDVVAQELYKIVLDAELNNFEVRFANNGYEAIGIYKDVLPTLVITDHDMPLMNGIQLVEAIQKKEKNKAIPIIVISARLDDDLIKKYTKLGAEKILSKPFDQKILIKAIKECLY